MSEKEIVLISPLYRIDKRTRTTKLMESCASLGIAVHLVSWDRFREYPMPSIDNKLESVSVLMKGGGYGGGKMALLYPIWMFRLFIHLVLRKRNRRYYCLGFENAFPVFIASAIFGGKYLFDDADRFSMIVGLPSLPHKILCFFERKTSEHSVVNIIPGLSRYEFRNNKQRIIRNNPDQKSVSRAALIEPIEKPAELVIYINGWLGESRGLPTALSIAKKLGNSKDANAKKIRFIAAGRLDGPSSEEFVQLENVDYFGEVANEKAHSLYGVADFVFTYYDPVFNINRYAESNKWGDSIAYRVPIIVNSEVKTADFLLESNCCVAFDYSDYQAVYDFLMDAVVHPDIIQTLKDNTGTVADQGSPFDIEIEETLKELLS